jgi:hypothetical protein
VESGAKDSIKNINSINNINNNNKKNSNKSDNNANNSSSSSNNKNNFSSFLTHNTFASIEEAIKNAQPGDTILLSPGHYWEHNIDVFFPLKFICNEAIEDCSRCVLEITGRFRIHKNAKSVVFLGVSIRRPRKLKNARSLVFVENSKILVFFLFVFLFNAIFLKIYYTTILYLNFIIF